ncbi:unnamed protein product [Caretta caretta]
MAEVSWTGLVAGEALVFSAVAFVPVSVDSVVEPEGKNLGVVFATLVFAGIVLVSLGLEVALEAVAISAVPLVSSEVLFSAGEEVLLHQKGKNLGVVFATVVSAGIVLVSLGLEVALEAVGISAVPLVPSEVLVSARGDVVGLDFTTVLWATVAVIPFVVVGRGAKVMGTDVLLDISVDLPDGIPGETVVVSSFALVFPSVSAISWGVLIFGRTVDISISIEELAVVCISDLLVLSGALTPEFSSVLLPTANVLSVGEVV